MLPLSSLPSLVSEEGLFSLRLHLSSYFKTKQAPFDKVEPLVYKYSASLMAADPSGTIQTW